MFVLMQSMQMGVQTWGLPDSGSMDDDDEGDAGKMRKFLQSRCGKLSRIFLRTLDVTTSGPGYDVCGRRDDRAEPASRRGDGSESRSPCLDVEASIVSSPNALHKTHFLQMIQPTLASSSLSQMLNSCAMKNESPPNASWCRQQSHTTTSWSPTTTKWSI